MAFGVFQGASFLILSLTIISANADESYDCGKHVNDYGLADAFKKCEDSTCFSQCVAGFLGYLDQNYAPILDQETLAAGLTPTFIVDLPLARLYAEGFLKAANCPGLLATGKSCELYDYLFNCAIGAGCEFAIDGYSVNLTKYGDVEYWRGGGTHRPLHIVSQLGKLQG